MLHRMYTLPEAERTRLLIKTAAACLKHMRKALADIERTNEASCERIALSWRLLGRTRPLTRPTPTVTKRDMKAHADRVRACAERVGDPTNKRFLLDLAGEREAPAKRDIGS